MLWPKLLQERQRQRQLSYERVATTAQCCMCAGCVAGRTKGSRLQGGRARGWSRAEALGAKGSAGLWPEVWKERRQAFEERRSRQ
jgi:hypothetical protein